MPMPRKADELHAQAGTKPHDRASDLSHVKPGRPRFPKDLDAALRPIFKRLCALLADRRALTAGDAEIIRLYCFAYDRHERNAALLRQEGEICEYERFDSNGAVHTMLKANLRMKIVADTERQMAAYLNQLGMTVVAKDRGKPTPKVDDPKAGMTPAERALHDLEEGFMKPRPAAPLVFKPLAPPTEEPE